MPARRADLPSEVLALCGQVWYLTGRKISGIGRLRFRPFLIPPGIRRFSSAVEQRFCKPKVGSSILSTGTSNYSNPGCRDSVGCSNARPCSGMTELTLASSDGVARDSIDRARTLDFHRFCMRRILHATYRALRGWFVCTPRLFCIPSGSRFIFRFTLATASGFFPLPQGSRFLKRGISCQRSRTIAIGVGVAVCPWAKTTQIHPRN
jgi:hypothetical protein